MSVVGLDFDTRALHLVFLDDDTNAARYVPVPFVGHKPPFELGDARNVRPRLQEAIARQADGWDGVWLLGLEKPYSQSRTTIWNYGVIVGAILACVPRHVCVLELPPQEWKLETVGQPSASKAAVHDWAWRELTTLDARPAEVWDRANWSQDAFDAYCIARAARALNARAVGGAAGAESAA